MDEAKQVGEALSAWEDINPPMALARQPGLPSRCSERLTPATNVQFRDELTACLALVAPVGMTEESRGEWLAVAWATLKHLPADILAMGCKVARETCDHPSKIVPTILKATEQSMAWRREARQGAPLRTLQPPSPPPLTQAELDALDSETVRLGLKYGFLEMQDGKLVEVQQQG